MEINFDLKNIEATPTTWCAHDISRAIKAGVLERLDIKDVVQLRVRGNGKYILSRAEKWPGAKEELRQRIVRSVTNSYFLMRIEEHLRIAIKTAHPFVATYRQSGPDVNIWVEITIVAIPLA